MLLSQSCIYGIKAVLLLTEYYNNNDNRYISTKEIGKELNISFYFLSKILKILAEADVVETYRGPKGGIKLNRSPDKITLIEVIEAIEGEDVLGECLLDKTDCEKYKFYELHKRWTASKEFIRENLWQVSLEELIKEI